MIGNTILYVPPLIVTEAKQDAPISSILALCFGICLTVLYNFIECTPTKTVVQYNEYYLVK
ncbi:hypothetical protein KHA80_05220 [Anaerobacillus sp. HL2]|nr:hypothetical protein KHA80_05220 [Anaerobacillus sp. HL2]